MLGLAGREVAMGKCHLHQLDQFWWLQGFDVGGPSWAKRDLSAKRYVYIWADGIHLQARLEDEAQCILVIIGATPEGTKELVGFTDDSRESAYD